jgi:ribosomal subunit interface protein
MQIQVSGKGVDVGEALRTHVQARTEEAINKYIDRINSVQVIMSKEAHNFRADIHANIGTHAGLVVRSHATSSDAHAAFDNALEKVEKQLRRYKRKLTNHHKISYGAAEDDIAGEARKYVLPANFGEHDEDEKPIAGVVIAEKATAVDTLTVSQAVMKMDLQDLPAVLFKNVASGRLNVVYRRADGNISWVDPAEKAA